MELSDYAQALGAAQQLVPNWDEPDRRRAALQGQQIQNQLGQQQVAENQQALDEGAAFRADIGTLGAKPTAEACRSMALKYPRFFRPIAEVADAMDAAHKLQTVSHLAQIGSAITANRPDLAAAQVQRHIDADKAAGKQPDPEDVALVDMLNSGDAEKIKGAGVLVHGSLAVLDDKAAKATAPDQENHFTSTGDGAVYDQRTGDIVRQAPPKAEYRTVKNADGSESIVQVSGEGGGRASGGGAGSGQPRNARNNNPGNIEDGPFARSQPGYRGSDGRFAIFADKSAGAAAQGALLGSYIDRGFNTVAKIIGRWAPPSDGNKTGAYIGAVAKALNVNPSDVLTKASIPKLQAAIERQEGAGPSNATPKAAAGPRVVFTSQPGAANPVDQATVDFYAQKIAAGGDLPQLGSGKESSAWRRAILARAAELQRSAGLSGGESNLAQADVKANRSALLQAQKQYTSTVGFEDTFQRNVKEVLRLAPSGVAGGVPAFNRWIQAGRRSLKGDPAVSAFNVAVNTAANEYAKLASGASGGAVTSDSARHEAMEILNNAQTLPQLQASIRQMQVDGHNRVVALDTQIKRLRGNISGAGRGNTGGGPTQVKTLQQALALPKGTVFIDPRGVRRVR